MFQLRNVPADGEKRVVYIMFEIGLIVGVKERSEHVDSSRVNRLVAALGT